MPAWSPSDLTNPSFVKTQLSAKDRSNALFSTTNELNSAEARLKQQEAALLAAQEAQNNGPGRGQINELKAKSNDPSLTAAERTQAAEQAAALSDQRDKNNVAAANALEKFNSTRQYVTDLTVGQSNLLQAGAVPPGVSSFAAPPGYEGRNSPAQDVPASQNASATPPQTTQELQSASPALISDPALARQQAILEENNASEQQLIDPNTDPNTNIGNDSQEQPPQPQQTISLASDPNTNLGEEGQDVTGFEPLREPPSTTDGDEFSGIDAQVAANENTLQEPPMIGDEDPFEAARIRAGEEFDNTSLRTEQDIFAAEGVTNAAGLQGKIENARAQQITQDAENAKTQGDWRVRLSLAPSAGYLYKAQNPGILLPLQKTDGVIFPYTPSIQVTYAAHYDPAELTHSNYKIFQYKNSSVDQITISCDFTAQDNDEANYLLAVIHFFRSVTKMFYGNDSIPKPGTPPPLCYLSGMGDFQFDRHPLAISSFNYSLPTDVDYIRASSPTLLSGVNATGYNDNRNSDLTPQQVRMQSGTTHLNAGAKESAPNFGKATNTQPTYVPTKISISIVAYPIVTRNDISNTFSLAEYATGKLLQGSKRNGGGIW